MSSGGFQDRGFGPHGSHFNGPGGPRNSVSNDEALGPPSGFSNRNFQRGNYNQPRNAGRSGNLSEGWSNNQNFYQFQQSWPQNRVGNNRFQQPSFVRPPFRANPNQTPPFQSRGGRGNYNRGNVGFPRFPSSRGQGSNFSPRYPFSRRDGYAPPQEQPPPLLGSEEERRQKITEAANELKRNLQSNIYDDEFNTPDDDLTNTPISKKDDSSSTVKFIPELKHGPPELDLTPSDLKDIGRVDGDITKTHNTSENECDSTIEIVFDKSKDKIEDNIEREVFDVEASENPTAEAAQPEISNEKTRVSPTEGSQLLSQLWAETLHDSSITSNEILDTPVSGFSTETTGTITKSSAIHEPIAIDSTTIERSTVGHITQIAASSPRLAETITSDPSIQQTTFTEHKNSPNESRLTLGIQISDMDKTEKKKSKKKKKKRTWSSLPPEELKPTDSTTTNPIENILLPETNTSQLVESQDNNAFYSQTFSTVADDVFLKKIPNLDETKQDSKTVKPPKFNPCQPPPSFDRVPVQPPILEPPPAFDPRPPKAKNDLILPMMIPGFDINQQHSMIPVDTQDSSPHGFNPPSSSIPPLISRSMTSMMPSPLMNIPSLTSYNIPHVRYSHMNPYVPMPYPQTTMEHYASALPVPAPALPVPAPALPVPAPKLPAPGPTHISSNPCTPDHIDDIPLPASTPAPVISEDDVLGELRMAMEFAKQAWNMDDSNDASANFVEEFRTFPDLPPVKSSSEDKNLPKFKPLASEKLKSKKSKEVKIKLPYGPRPNFEQKQTDNVQQKEESSVEKDTVETGSSSMKKVQYKTIDRISKTNESIEKISEKRTEKLSEKRTEKPSEKRIEKQPEKRIEKQPEKSSEKRIEKPPEKSIETLSEKLPETSNSGDNDDPNRRRVVFNLNSQFKRLNKSCDWKEEQENEKKLSRLPETPLKQRLLKMLTSAVAVVSPTTKTPTAAEKKQPEIPEKSSRKSGKQPESSEPTDTKKSKDQKSSTESNKQDNSRENGKNDSVESSRSSQTIKKNINISSVQHIDLLNTINQKKPSSPISKANTKKPSGNETGWKDRVIGRFLKMSKNDIQNMINNTNLRKFDIAMQHLVKEKKSSLSLQMRNYEEEKMKNTSYDKEDFFHQLKAILDPAATVDITDLPSTFIHQLSEVLQLDPIPGKSENIEEPESSLVSPGTSRLQKIDQLQAVESPVNVGSNAPVISSRKTSKSQKIDNRVSKDSVKNIGNTIPDSNTSNVCTRAKRNKPTNPTIPLSISDKTSIQSPTSNYQSTLNMDDLDDIFTAGLPRAKLVNNKSKTTQPSSTQRRPQLDLPVVQSRMETPIVERLEKQADELDKIFTAGIQKAKAASKSGIATTMEDESHLHERRRCKRENSREIEDSVAEMWRRKGLDDIDGFWNLTKEEYEARQFDTVHHSHSNDNEYRSPSTMHAKRPFTMDREIILHTSKNSFPVTPPNLLSSGNFEPMESGSDSGSDSDSRSSSSYSSEESIEEDPTIDVSKMLKYIKEREKIAKKKSFNEEIRDEVAADIARKRKDNKCSKHKVHKYRTKKREKRKREKKGKKKKTKRKKKHRGHRTPTQSESSPHAENESSNRLLRDDEIKTEIQEDERPPVAPVTQSTYRKKLMQENVEPISASKVTTVATSASSSISIAPLLSPMNNPTTLTTTVKTISSPMTSPIASSPGLRSPARSTPSSVPPSPTMTQKTKAQLKQMPLSTKLDHILVETRPNISLVPTSLLLEIQKKTDKISESELNISQVSTVSEAARKTSNILEATPPAGVVESEVDSDQSGSKSSQVSNTSMPEKSMTSHPKKLDIKAYHKRALQRKCSEQEKVKRLAENPIALTGHLLSLSSILNSPKNLEILNPTNELKTVSINNKSRTRIDDQECVRQATISTELEESTQPALQVRKKLKEVPIQSPTSTEEMHDELTIATFSNAKSEGGKEIKLKEKFKDRSASIDLEPEIQKKNISPKKTLSNPPGPASFKRRRKANADADACQQKNVEELQTPSNLIQKNLSLSIDKTIASHGEKPFLEIVKKGAVAEKELHLKFIDYFKVDKSLISDGFPDVVPSEKMEYIQAKDDLETAMEWENKDDENVLVASNKTVSAEQSVFNEASEKFVTTEINKIPELSVDSVVMKKVLDEHVINAPVEMEITSITEANDKLPKVSSSVDLSDKEINLPITGENVLQKVSENVEIKIVQVESIRGASKGTDFSESSRLTNIENAERQSNADMAELTSIPDTQILSRFEDDNKINSFDQPTIDNIPEDGNIDDLEEIDQQNLQESIAETEKLPEVIIPESIVDVLPSNVVDTPEEKETEPLPLIQAESTQWVANDSPENNLDLAVNIHNIAVPEEAPHDTEDVTSSLRSISPSWPLESTMSADISTANEYNHFSTTNVVLRDRVLAIVTPRNSILDDPITFTSGNSPTPEAMEFGILSETDVIPESLYENHLAVNSREGSFVEDEEVAQTLVPLGDSCLNLVQTTENDNITDIVSNADKDLIKVVGSSSPARLLSPILQDPSKLLTDIIPEVSQATIENLEVNEREKGSENLEENKPEETNENLDTDKFEKINENLETNKPEESTENFEDNDEPEESNENLKINECKEANENLKIISDFENSKPDGIEMSESNGSIEIVEHPIKIERIDGLNKESIDKDYTETNEEDMESIHQEAPEVSSERDETSAQVEQESCQIISKIPEELPEVNPPRDRSKSLSLPPETKKSMPDENTSTSTEIKNKKPTKQVPVTDDTKQTKHADHHSKSHKRSESSKKSTKTSSENHIHKKHKHHHEKKKTKITSTIVQEAIKADIATVVNSPSTKNDVMARMREIDLTIQNLISEKMRLYQMLESDDWTICSTEPTEPEPVTSQKSKVKSNTTVPDKSITSKILKPSVHCVAETAETVQQETETEVISKPELRATPVREHTKPTKISKVEEKSRSTIEEKSKPLPKVEKKKKHRDEKEQTKHKESRRESSPISKKRTHTGESNRKDKKLISSAKTISEPPKKSIKLSSLITRDFKPKPSSEKHKATASPANKNQDRSDESSRKSSERSSTPAKSIPKTISSILDTDSSDDDEIIKQIPTNEAKSNKVGSVSSTGGQSLAYSDDSNLDTTEPRKESKKKSTGLSLLEESFNREIASKRKTRLSKINEKKHHSSLRKNEKKMKVNEHVLEVIEAVATNRVEDLYIEESTKKNDNKERKQVNEKDMEGSSNKFVTKEKSKESTTAREEPKSETSSEAKVSKASSRISTPQIEDDDHRNEEGEWTTLDSVGFIDDKIEDIQTDSNDTNSIKQRSTPVLIQSEKDEKRLEMQRKLLNDWQDSFDSDSQDPTKVTKETEKSNEENAEVAKFLDKKSTVAKTLEESTANYEKDGSIKDTKIEAVEIKPVVEEPERSKSTFKELESSKSTVKDLERSKSTVKELERSKSTTKELERSKSTTKEIEKLKSSAKDQEQPKVSLIGVKRPKSRVRIINDDDDSPADHDEEDDDDDDDDMHNKKRGRSKKRKKLHSNRRNTRYSKDRNKSNSRSLSRSKRAIKSSSRDSSPEVERKKRPVSGESTGSISNRRRSSLASSYYANFESKIIDDRSLRRGKKRKIRPERTREQMMSCQVRLVDIKYTYLRPDLRPSILHRLGIRRINPWALKKLEAPSKQKIDEKNRSDDDGMDIVEVSDAIDVSSNVEIVSCAENEDDNLSDKSPCHGFSLSPSVEVIGRASSTIPKNNEIDVTEVIDDEDDDCIQEIPNPNGANESSELKIIEPNDQGVNSTNMAVEESGENSSCEPKITRYTVHKGPILDIKVFGDSFLAASEDGAIYRYTQKSNSILNIYKGHEAAVTCLYVHEIPGITDIGNKKWYLFSGSLDGTLRCYDIMTGSLNRHVVNIGSPVQCMDQSWGQIFIGTKSGHISRYDIKSGSLREDNLDFSDKPILALRTSTEGPRRVLIVASRNQPITIRDAQNGLFLRTISGQKTHTVYSLMRDSGNLVYCGTSSTSIPVFDFLSGEQVAQYTAGVGIVCMRIYRQLLFAGCYDGNIYVFDVKESKLLSSIPGPGNMLLSMEIKDDIIIAGSKDRRLHAWRMPEHIRLILIERS